MPLATFTPKNRYPYTEQPRFLTTLAKLRGGGESRRGAWGFPHRSFSLPMRLLTDDDAAYVENFIAAREGRLGEFEWVSPLTGITHTVRFDHDESPLRATDKKTTEGTVTMIEVTPVVDDYSFPDGHDTLELPVKFPFVEHDTNLTETTSLKGGIEHRAGKYDAPLRAFDLTWQYLTTAQAQYLNGFFCIHGGRRDSFMYQSPITATNYTVRFDTDELTLSMTAHGLWSASARVVEVV